MTEQAAEDEAAGAPVDVVVIVKVETVAFDKVVSEQVEESPDVKDSTAELVETNEVDGETIGGAVELLGTSSVVVGTTVGVTGTTLINEIDPGVTAVSEALKEGASVVFDKVISVVAIGVNGYD